MEPLLSVRRSPDLVLEVIEESSSSSLVTLKLHMNTYKQGSIQWGGGGGGEVSISPKMFSFPPNLLQ